MIKLSKKITVYKFIIANNLMIFCLNKKINNNLLLKVILAFYYILMHDSYILMHKSSNHHYIPRFILKKFKIINTGLIFQYARCKNPERKSIEKEAACIENLYSFNDKFSKSKSDFIENQLFAFSLEKYASRIIRQIIDEKDEIRLTNLERSILTSYVSFQYVRTPKFLYFIQLMLEYLHIEKGISIDEILRIDFYKKSFFENYYQIDQKQFYKFSIRNNLNIEGIHDLILRLSIQIGDHLSSLIYKGKLNFLNAQEPAFFYLSDSPAEIFNLIKNRTVGPFLWEMKDNPLIFMPISPSLCLYFLKDTIPPPHIIGHVIEIAIPKSVHDFAFSDRINDKIIID
jgi:hypothetical protein